MSEVLAQRYGAPRRARRMLLLVLVGVIAVAGLGWTLWAAWFHGNQPIRAEVHSFKVLDVHTVEARIDLTLRDRDTTGTCLLRATAQDHTPVGDRAVRVEELAAAPSPWVRIRTEREATTVELVSCSAD